MPEYPLFHPDLRCCVFAAYGKGHYLQVWRSDTLRTFEPEGLPGLLPEPERLSRADSAKRRSRLSTAGTQKGGQPVSPQADL